MKQSTKKLLALLTAGMLCAGSLGALPAFAETEGEVGENDTIDTAESIEVNTDVTGNLSTTSDVDYYRLDLTENSLLELSFQHDRIDRSYELWDYTIADSNGTTIRTWEINGTQSSFTTPQMGFAKGTYYLVVTSTPNDAPDINYTISANSVTDIDGTFETERNDDIDTASTLPLNMPCIGNLYETSDKDYYQLNLEEDSLLNLTFQHNRTDRSYELWDYTIADSNGTAIHTWGISGTQTNFTTPQMGFAKGTYYLVVTSTPNDAPDINYTISANSVTDITGTFETERNDDIDTASTLPLNTPCIGNLYETSDKDYYQLNLEEDSLLSLTFQHDKTNSSYALWTYSITDSKGYTLETWESEGNQSNSTTPEVKLTKGTYYLIVKSTPNDAPDINYTLTVNADAITYTKGDVNNDGNIDSSDVFEMMYSCALKAVGKTTGLLEGDNFLAADIDENGTLDSTDIFYEMLYIASKGAGVPVDWDSIVK